VSHWGSTLALVLGRRRMRRRKDGAFALARATRGMVFPIAGNLAQRSGIGVRLGQRLGFERSIAAGVNTQNGGRAGLMA
jgi:hypothetical protein